jgi:hypothetical protein
MPEPNAEAVDHEFFFCRPVRTKTTSASRADIKRLSGVDRHNLNLDTSLAGKAR